MNGEYIELCWQSAKLIPNDAIHKLKIDALSIQNRIHRFPSAYFAMKITSRKNDD